VIRRSAAALVIMVVFCACGAPKKTAGQPLLELDGIGSVDKTAWYTAANHWTLSYRWDCARARQRGNPNASGFQYTLFNADDDSTAFESPRVMATGVNGTGEVDYATAGQYYLQISTACEWRVSAVPTNPA
jgi:hypothetical protein